MAGQAHAEAREFIDRFVESWGGDDRVAAVFLSGSLARGTGDAFSDVDLIVVAAEGRYDDLFRDRWALMDRLGELVLSDDFDGFGRDFLLFLYRDGVHGEVDLQRSGEASWSDPGELLPLVDNDDVLRSVTAWGEPDTSERVSECDRLVRGFWRHVWHASGALGRGTLLSAAGYLDDARRAAVDLARFAADLATPWAFSGYEHAERALDVEDQARLARTFTPLRAADMHAALVDLVEMCQGTLEELHRRHGVDTGQDTGAVVTRRLREVGR